MANRILIALASALVAAALGFYAGGAAATKHYEAKIAKDDSARAQAALGAYQDALHISGGNAIRAALLERQLLTAQANLTAERKNINRRIHDAIQATASTCAGLPPEWGLLYNNATAPASDCARAGALHPGGLAATTPTSGAALSGVLQGQPLIDPADALAHARDYGEYCKRLELIACGRLQDEEAQ